MKFLNTKEDILNDVGNQSFLRNKG